MRRVTLVTDNSDGQADSTGDRSDVQFKDVSSKTII